MSLAHARESFLVGHCSKSLSNCRSLGQLEPDSRILRIAVRGAQGRQICPLRLHSFNVIVDKTNEMLADVNTLCIWNFRHPSDGCKTEQVTVKYLLDCVFQGNRVVFPINFSVHLKHFVVCPGNLAACQESLAVCPRILAACPENRVVCKALRDSFSAITLQMWMKHEYNKWAFFISCLSKVFSFKQQCGTRRSQCSKLSYVRNTCCS